MNVQDILDQPALRDAFVSQGVSLIDSEVAKKGGFGGMALKAGYAAVKGLKPGITREALDALLPHFLPAVAEHVSKALAQGNVVAYFQSNAGVIAEALLSVTDAKVGSSANPVIAKTYGALRSTAKQHTTEAVPGVGRILASLLA